MLLALYFVLLSIVPTLSDMHEPHALLYEPENYIINFPLSKGNDYSNIDFPFLEDINVDTSKIEIKDGNLIVNRRIITPIHDPVIQVSSIITPSKKVLYLTGNIAISEIESGKDGQELMIIGGVGSALDLSAITNAVISSENTSNFINEGDILSLVYIEEIQKWIQLSYSNN